MESITTPTSSGMMPGERSPRNPLKTYTGMGKEKNEGNRLKEESEGHKCNAESDLKTITRRKIVRTWGDVPLPQIDKDAGDRVGGDTIDPSRLKCRRPERASHVNRHKIKAKSKPISAPSYHSIAVSPESSRVHIDPPSSEMSTDGESKIC